VSPLSSVRTVLEGYRDYCSTAAPGWWIVGGALEVFTHGGRQLAIFVIGGVFDRTGPEIGTL